ncbi:probable ATP-dependent RNA helicase CG8611 [Anopheles ziemanni]|uniref:probable ATP-dependent RNA helicase CG8611 n=1 Tax=Anopheles coustani TaxID=139045 RepID=UPI00265AC084|nr:probable ATP-dependent RNA helicase CG8611 [Anopheles coustani]XP_058175795.1 probable ATP-dependent RNA helicase CG8611 [Anopheles ziemanni]
MDLMLSNVVVDSPPNVKENAGIKKNNANGLGDGGFSMILSKSGPRKAVVARKRVVAKVPLQVVKSKPIQAANKPAVKGSVKQEPQKFPIAQPTAKLKGKNVATNSNSETNGVSKKEPSKNGAPKVHTRETIPQEEEDEGDKDTSKKNSVFNFQSNATLTNRSQKTSMFDRFKKDLPTIDLPRVQPLEEQVFSKQTIEALEIHPHSKKNIADLLSYTHLTMVQSMAIPRLMEGRDALIRAQTGSGKTLAYALPLIEQLHNIRPKTSRTDGILAVVIVPTRELALQTYELMVKLLKPYTWIVSGFLCGGEKRKTEKARLRAGLNILIGTPGRFCDHIRNTESLKLGNVRWLVLDEADRLLELGYEKDVKEIVSAIQEGSNAAESTTDVDGKARSLQTVLLSATLTSSVKELAGLTLHDPVYVETSEAIRQRQTHAQTFDGPQSADHLLNVDECVSIPQTVKQRYLVIPPKLRLVTLSGLIASEQHKKPSKALIFMATQDLVDFHYDVMVEVLTAKQLDSDDEMEDDEESEDTTLLPRVSFFKLHGGMTQIERSAVFLKFRAAKAAVLLCTDMVARGIDIPCVDLVVQYHAPQILADYVHRVGRTARAGQTGKAILFIEPAEIDFIKYLADKQISIQEQKIDGIFVHLGQKLKCGQKTVAKNKEQAAIRLQRRFEQLITKEKELFASASKAFVSWIRYYSNFPKELRRMFAVKGIHMGHYAQSLGLRDAPKQFMHAHTGPKDEASSNATLPAKAIPGHRKNALHTTKRPGNGLTNRTMGKVGGYQQRGDNRPGGQTMAEFAKRSRVLNTSEFASGLEPAHKKAKH